MTKDQAANYLEILSLLELCCKQASSLLKKERRLQRRILQERILQLPQELQDMIHVEAAHDWIEDIESWGVIGARLVLGGIRSERRAKVREIKGNHKRPESLHDETRNGIYWCERDEIPNINMEQLSEITKAGGLIKDARFRVVFLPKYSRPDLVSCSVNKETTHIVIHSTAFRTLDGFRGQRSEAITEPQRALKHELENVGTRKCTITWPEDSMDHLWQYRISKEVKILEVRGLKSAFGRDAIPVRFRPEEEEFEEYEDSLHPEVNLHHWIHQLIRRFESLDELKFEYISPADLTNLGHWLMPIKVLRTG